MNIVYFGSSGFSVPPLRAISDKVTLVVTRRAKPKGRGYGTDDTEVKRCARDLGIPVVEIDSFKDEAAEALREIDPELFMVVSFGLIVPRWALDIPSLGPVNVHPSLLPRYRGPSPIQWALLNGDASTGITLIRMNEKMDAGRIIYQEEVSIGPRENMSELSGRLAERTAEILPEMVARIAAGGMMDGVEQEHDHATFTPIITKEMGFITWGRASQEIDRQIRAFEQWPTAYTFLDGKMLKIYDAEPLGDSEFPEAGRVLDVNRDGFLVATARGSLLVKEVQMENKKRVKAFDFANGYRGLREKLFGT